MSRLCARAALWVTAAGCAACHTATPRLQLVVQSAGVADAGQSLRYVLQIRSADVASVWVVGCDVVRPRFEYRDGDGAVGATDVICDRDRLFELRPGATLRDSGTVVRHAGAAYVPSVTVSRAADGRDARVLRGATFIAP